ncbi:small subunit ribosomal protein S20 [Virgibacillus natechei]|uniref:Small ribosomal subunit protein bS20 n=1 Tax=Virgibacillus natechei TaxID=1216297 RepID=A0ABS4ICQ0_9BACI|nr:30S ribosomal protein S20 [Virgibacillus natechei]MBP1968722.1 small subunit ribosomal protein S20 [Virgibacillus natechei]UZD11524.1 30S ribosomal protein S20 [Virgibacillus natechei]
MANIKSAIKRVDTNNKKRVINQAQKSEMRTQIKHVEKLVEANDVENAKLALQKTMKYIDKAIQKGVIHQNNGDRQKSRLANKVSNLSA